MIIQKNLSFLPSMSKESAEERKGKEERKKERKRKGKGKRREKGGSWMEFRLRSINVDQR